MYHLTIINVKHKITPDGDPSEPQMGPLVFLSHPALHQPMLEILPCSHSTSFFSPSPSNLESRACSSHIALSGDPQIL